MQQLNPDKFIKKELAQIIALAIHIDSSPIVSLFCFLQIIIASPSTQVALADHDCRPELRLEIVTDSAKLGRRAPTCSDFTATRQSMTFATGQRIRVHRLKSKITPIYHNQK
jgi:hypothetical protein